MPLTRKLALAIVTILVVPTLVLAAALLAVFDRQPSALPLVLGVGLVLLLAYATTTAYALGLNLVRAIQRIQLETELMATVNPDHRLVSTGADELGQLTAEINNLADTMQTAQVGLQQQVQAATEALEGEREKLVDVLESLSEPVLLVAGDGRVTLANRAARDLIGPALLGRSVFELANRERIAPYLQRLRDGTSHLEPLRVDDFEAVASPFHDADQRVVGFTLVVRAAPRLPQQQFKGMGTRSGWHDAATGSDRPDLYDFALLDSTERSVAAIDRARRLDTLSYVVLDLETTGLHPEAGDRIVSIAGVKLMAGMAHPTVFDALVNPQRRIPATSTSFHGITDDMVSAAPAIDVVLPAFVDFARESVLVGHQVSFDLQFLDREARRLGLPPLSGSHVVVDTLLLSAIVHGPLSEHGLDAVSARLGVPVEGRHSALGDALATAEVLRRLIDLLAKRDIVTLGQAIDAAHRAEPGLLASLRAT